MDPILTKAICVAHKHRLRDTLLTLCHDERTANCARAMLLVPEEEAQRKVFDKKNKWSEDENNEYTGDEDEDED